MCACARPPATRLRPGFRCADMSDTYTMPDRRTLIRNPYLGTRWVRFGAGASLPPLPCCYVVYQGSELLYIGQTNNLRERFGYHAGHARFPTGFRLKVRFGERYGDWAMRELRLIRRIRPPMNSRVV
ncbi:GIY-YIG nuclease family protein [Xanthomonas oryzae pv. oryzicola]